MRYLLGSVSNQSLLQVNFLLYFSNATSDSNEQNDDRLVNGKSVLTAAGEATWEGAYGLAGAKAQAV
jgi:hypothetical protein